jgi:hypothetical protein
MRLIALAITVLAICAAQIVSGSSAGQQFGFVDLTHAIEPAPASDSGAKESLPDGCQKLEGGMIADGFVGAENDQPRDIAVEVTKLDNATANVGGDIQAEVQLRNTGTLDVQIPWSTDPDTSKYGQGPSRYEWEQGTFELGLKNERGDGILLKTFIAALYGSEYAPRSELSLPPGGYVTARVKFKLEDQFPFVRQLDPGIWQLSARWEQVRRDWFVVNCKVTNGYFRYDSYYRQKRPAVTIQVLAAAPKSGQETQH